MNSPGPETGKKNDQRRELACKRLTTGERTREDTTPEEASQP
jgi:hypothetical protein